MDTSPRSLLGVPTQHGYTQLTRRLKIPRVLARYEPAQMVASSGMWLEILRVMGPFLHSAQALRNSQSDTICL